MSSNKKRLYQNKLKISLMLALLLIITCLIFITWPIWKSYNKSVDIMQLTSNTKPVFTLSSILPYEHEVTMGIINNPSYSNSSVNLSLNINDLPSNSNELLDDLQLLSNSFPSNNQPIFLSFLPLENTSIDDYINAFSSLKDVLKNKNLSNVQLIPYLQSGNSSHSSNYTFKKSVLKKYQNLNSSYIGLTLSSIEDLKLLNSIYNTLDSSITLVLNDVIPQNNISDSITGAETINYIYYNLAVKYPRIETIYSPYVTLTRNKWLKDIHAELLPALDTRYIHTYENLISKPWITIKSEETTSISPYTALKDYDTLSNDVELILSPDSPLLKTHKNKSKNTSYINYRINTQVFKVQSYYPYELTLDTTSLPNGINRFKALAYNNIGTIISAPSIDLIISNDNVSPRVTRLQKHYSLDQKPIYTSEYIPILMYHTIADTVVPEDENSCVETSIFESQIKSLIDNGYTPITFNDLENYLENKAGLPEKPILITMDDGYLNNYTLAYPIYKKYNIPATLFVSPYYMEQENTDRHFGFNAAREMEASGLIDIESHGYNHTPFTHLSLRDVKYHISISKGILEQNLGKRDTFTFAYPQFRNTYLTRKTLTTQGVNFQITKLAKSGTGLQSSHLKRINVPNTMSPEELIATLQSLTS
ncbi:polysaccharide deacetylase family protein [Cellulosilyticum ruminicola]